jgi:AcrR family transcriptional regulator
MSITREKILELGEHLICTKGYNAFSYQDISSGLGIKNAAVHYYFPFKENLGTSIAKTNIQRFEEMIENMHSRDFDEWKQLETFLKIYAKGHREQKKCLVGSLGPDFCTLNESTKSALSKLIEIILKWLTELLKNGRITKVFSFDGVPEIKAFTIFSSLVASLQMTSIFDKVDYKFYQQSILDDLKP